MTEAHLRLRSTSSRYHVVVEVIASEDGPDGIGHVERRFERTHPAPAAVDKAGSAVLRELAAGAASWLCVPETASLCSHERS